MSLTLVRPAVFPLAWTPIRSNSFSGRVEYNPQSARHNQWPWRALAFASDAGFIAYLAGGQRLRPWAHRAWLLSIPYYAYALSQADNPSELKRETAFQLTANGLLPYVTVHSAAQLASRFSGPVWRFWSTLKATPMRQFVAAWRTVAATTALILLTPTVNDRLVTKFFSQGRYR